MRISESVQSWVTLLTNLGVLAGLLLLVVEINQNSNQLALQLKFEANQKLFDANRDLLVPEMASVYAKSITAPEDLIFSEGIMAGSLVLNWLNAWEDRYWIYQAGLISDREWKQELSDSLPWLLGNRFAKRVWASTRAEYEPEFAAFIDSELAGITDDVSYQWWLEVRSGWPEMPAEK